MHFSTPFITVENIKQLREMHHCLFTCHLFGSQCGARKANTQSLFIPFKFDMIVRMDGKDKNIGTKSMAIFLLSFGFKGAFDF